MNLTPELWQRIDPLLTDALELDAAAREVWLCSLDQTQPQLTPLLRKMLAAHDRAERSQELETAPRLVPAPAPASAFAAGARVGPFALIRPLGRGGMGEVWLARQADGRVEREVALKLPTIYLQSEVWRERFRRERDILARLAHPNIARLFDAGVSEEEGSRGQPYLAMEYIEGVSLTEFAAAQKLPLAGRLVLFRQILAAVAHAHRHLVVHRDLKPANILIDQSGQVKLLDFGIAKLIDDGTEAARSADLTQMGGRLMTLRYAAPEQVAGEAITTATDIYALGVILHELVTGHSPYRAAREGRPLTEAMLGKVETGIPSALAPASIARQVRGDLDAIILKAMRRNPTDRYASIEQFDDDILRHLERRPVRARAGTWRYLAGRFITRHKLPMAMAAAVLVTLAAGLVMVDQQRRVAVAERERAARHFASVRKLANTLMFEVHGEIENLPGSLKAREMLVKTALQYLDSLAAEAADDPALALEVAVAYRKIGNIEGEPGGANTGDLLAARANYEKGKRLFVALEALRPNDVDVLREHERLSYALARSYDLIVDPRWQAEIATATALAGRIAALPGATTGDRAREAIVMIEQAALTSRRLGRNPGVEAMANQAVSKIEALARERPGDAVVLEALALIYARTAITYTTGNRTSQSVRLSIEFNRKAIAAAEKILAGKPDDERWLKFRASTLVQLSKTLAHAGEHGDADRTIGEALQLNAQLYARDPNNVELAMERLLTLENAATAAYRRGDMKRTVRFARETIAQGARLPETTRNTVSMRGHIAESKALIGGALLVLARAPSLDREKRLSMLTEARSLLIGFMAYIDEIRREKQGAFPESVVKEVMDAIKGCDEAIAKLSRN